MLSVRAGDVSEIGQLQESSELCEEHRHHEALVDGVERQPRAVQRFFGVLKSQTEQAHVLAESQPQDPSRWRRRAHHVASLAESRIQEYANGSERPQ